MSDISMNGETGSPRDQAACCEICAAQSRTVFDLLVKSQDLLVHSEPEREAFAARRGFCAFHMWLLKQIGDPLSLSRAFAPVVDAWADELMGHMAEPPGRAAARIESALPHPGFCEACKVQLATGADELRRVLAPLTMTEGRQRFSRGPGLCLRHLAVALHAGPAHEVAFFLLNDHVRRLQDVSKDLHNYTAKRDALRRDLLSEDEQNAWQRALVLLAGARTVHDAERG